MTVRVGVVYRLAMLTNWPLRREADAHTLEAPENSRWTVTGNTAR